ncbi:tRNA (adenine(58)-N(1))-methyltransferase non-catalytic subunit trm6 [Dimargaris xerosporica]|nr:tRNA (adenine(58)-N(1))-methyltransferase non-catalytic subunit trm6 [Dimargaris xerosporica]
MATNSATLVSPSPAPTGVCTGQQVIIRMPSGNYKAVKATPGAKIDLGKFGSCMADDIIGRPFGLTYEIYTKGRARPLRVESEYATVQETEATNREIMDDPQAQRLTHDEIQQLKESSLAGEVDHDTLIAKMAENNASFDKKTEFSKAKYIKRKKSKYSKEFTVVDPTLHNLWHFFFTRNSTKIRDIRIDTLAQLLAMLNVNAYSRLLVVDDTHGMVLSAVLSRLGANPQGQVLALHEGDSANFDLLKLMPLSTTVSRQLMYLSWSRINPDAPVQFDDKDMTEMSELDRRGHERRKATFLRVQAAQTALWQGGWDGLVIASQYQPESILNELVPYVGGSRPIVVYSPSKEPLVTTAAFMKTSPDYLFPQITESWIREYQVLPGRTHPLMTMNAGGGYLLNAIRVYDSPETVPIFSTPRLASIKPNKSGRLPAKRLKAVQPVDISGEGSSS